MMSGSVLPRTPSFRLDGRRALVTGAGRGIGLAAAAALAEAGADVTLCARSADEVGEIAGSIRAAGFLASTLFMDITDLDLVQQTLDAEEPYDILVNNAGTNRPKPLHLVEVADFDAVFDLNVRAAFFLSKHVASRLMELGRPGSLINMSSQLGHVGAMNRSLYVASKFAIEGLTKALAIELGPAGIRVNAIAPTFIDTPLTRSYGLDETALQSITSKISLGRIGAVEDLMGAIIYLASDASALVTGASLLVDGGWTAQ
ncbi:NAD(P)-dependent dehydrogenase (short-subunit alcohol dehydrogenase family) [Nitrobacteraceae bacterium AZCC 2146]